MHTFLSRKTETGVLSYLLHSSQIRIIPKTEIEGNSFRLTPKYFRSGEKIIFTISSLRLTKEGRRYYIPGWVKTEKLLPEIFPFVIFVRKTYDL